MNDKNIDVVVSHKEQKQDHHKGKDNHHHFHKEWTNPIEFLMVLFLSILIF
jgi:hypothetical protein